jgi:hypothetical protein
MKSTLALNIPINDSKIASTMPTIFQTLRRDALKAGTPSLTFSFMMHDILYRNTLRICKPTTEDPLRVSVGSSANNNDLFTVTHDFSSKSAT